MPKLTLLCCLLFTLSACVSPPEHRYDTIIRNGVLYDGTGANPVFADIAIKADTIAAIGDLSSEKDVAEMIDAQGKAIAPGFINMLSWANESLIEDGRSLSGIKQGITLELMGEGNSMGPWNDSMKVAEQNEQGDIKYRIAWTKLSEYLDFLEDRGIATNVASFVGAATVRIHELGYTNRPPKPQELARMKNLVREAMQEGAMGLSSALIYAPGSYADTPELIALAKVVSEYGGTYISHLRSEGNRFEQALDEFLSISKEANVHGEIYHLKAAGQSNWHKMNKVIGKIDSARRAGLNITSNMYTYTAGATGLDAAMPPWVQEGGLQEWRRRLKSYNIRQEVAKQMLTATDEWENLALAAGSPENIILAGFRQDSLKKYTGKTLAEVARIRKKTWVETAMNLVVEDNSRVGTIYFLMSEDNLRKQIQLPYMSFGSDAASLAPEGVFLKSNPHPRAYGNFARIFAKYVRDEKVLTLQEAIRKLTSLPARNLKIQKRGVLKVGHFADLVVFDPAKMQDKATFEKPHQLAEGMIHVFVNGKAVLKNGEHTGVKSGRVVRGPGWRGRE